MANALCRLTYSLLASHPRLSSRSAGRYAGERTLSPSPITSREFEPSEHFYGCEGGRCIPRVVPISLRRSFSVANAQGSRWSRTKSQLRSPFAARPSVPATHGDRTTDERCARSERIRQDAPEQRERGRFTGRLIGPSAQVSSYECLTT